MKSITRAHTIVALLSAILLLVTIAGLWLFGARIAERERRVLDTHNRLASFEQNKRTFAEENARLDTIRTHVTKLEQYIVTDDTAPTLLSSIEAMAQKEGIDFSLTTVASMTGTENAPAKLHIDFSADGSFSGIQRFINALLAQPYEVRMTRLSLYATDGTTQAQAGSWQLLAGIDVISF